MRHRVVVVRSSSDVSIHASVKDATSFFILLSHVLTVSIHASVKDATKQARKFKDGFSGFNPRICKRCDEVPPELRVDADSFNPRICKRCDRREDAGAPDDGCFNPRICKRCDFLSNNQGPEYMVSIHASVKDATLFAVITVIFYLFQSTHL